MSGRILHFLMTRALIGCLVMGSVGFVSRDALAQELTEILWTGNAGNEDWNEAGNWDLVELPSSSHRAIIPTSPDSGIFPLISSDTADIGAIYIQRGATLEVKSIVVTIIEDLTIESDGIFSTNQDLYAASIVSDGKFTQDGGKATITSTVDVAGLMTLNSGTFSAAGIFTVNAGGSLEIAGCDVTLSYNGADASALKIAGSVTLASGSLNLSSKGMRSLQSSASFVNSGGTLNLQSASATMTVGGAGQSAVQFTFSGGTSTLGHVEYYSGNTLTINGSATVNVKGNWGAVATGTFTHTAGTVALTSNAAQSIAGTPAFFNLTVNKSGNTATMSTAITVNGTFTLTAGTFDTGSNNMAIGGSWSHAAGATFTSGTAVVTFQGSTTPVTVSGAAATAFSSLTINKTSQSNVVKIQNASTVAGTLLLSSGTLELEAATMPGATLDLDQSGTTVSYTAGIAQTVAATTYHHLKFNKTANTATFAGPTTVNGDVTLTAGTVDASSRAINVLGNWTQNGGTFSGGTSTVTFSGATTPVAVGGTTISAFNNLTINKTNQTDVVKIQNASTVGDTLLLSAGTLQLEVAAMPGTTKDLDQANTTVTYAGGVAQTIAATTYNHLTVNKSADTATLGGTVTVNANFTLTAGTFAAGGNTMNVGGSFSNAVTFNQTTGAVVFTGTRTPVSVSGAGLLYFYNMTIQKSATTDTVQMGKDFMVKNTLTVNPGKLDTTTGNYTLTLLGGGTVASGSIKANASIINLGATLTFTAGTFSYDTSTVVVDGLNNQTIPANVQYYDLEINRDAETVGTSASISASLTVNRHLTFTAGHFTSNSNAISVGGNFYDNGVIETLGTSAITFSGATSPASIGGSDAFTFHKLVINKSTTTAIVRLLASAATSDTFTVTQGVFQVGAYTLTTGSTCSVAATGTLALNSSSSILKMANNTTMTISGQLQAAPSTGKAQIRSVSTNSLAITCASGATLNVNGLRIDNLNKNGFIIANGVTWSAFKNVAFYNNQGGAGSLSMDVTANALNVSLEGLYFDGTSDINIRLKGNGTGDGETVINMDYVDAATNGAGAGEADDLDDDNSPVDGVGDTPVSDGAVINWMVTKALVPGQASAKVVQVLRGINWLTFQELSYCYVFVQNVDDSGSEGIYTINPANGAVIGSLVITSGDVGADPGDMFPGIFDTVDESVSGEDANGNSAEDANVQMIYVCTDAGFVFRLWDDGGNIQFPGGGSPWKTAYSAVDVTTITSPLSTDGFTIFFGGTNDAATPKNRIFGVSIGKKAVQFDLPGTEADIKTFPAWRNIGGVNYLYVGSEYDASLTYACLFKVNGTDGVVEQTYNDCKASYFGPVNYTFWSMHLTRDDSKVDGVMYEGDELVSRDGWPFDTGAGAPIYGGVASSYFTGDVYFACDVGAYAVDKDGQLKAGWPVVLADPGVVHAAPLYDIATDRLIVSGQNGRVFVIDAADGSVRYTYNYGSNVEVSRISRDFITGKLIFGLESNGQIIFAEE